MAIVYRCDRCGEDGAKPNDIKIMTTVNHTNDYLWVAADLCERCVQALVEWVKPLPIEES